MVGGGAFHGGTPVGYGSVRTVVDEAVGDQFEGSPRCWARCLTVSSLPNLHGPDNYVVPEHHPGCIVCVPVHRDTGEVVHAVFKSLDALPFFQRHALARARHV